MLEEALTFASENIEFIVTTDDYFKISVTDKIEVLKCTEKQMNQLSELKTPSDYFSVPTIGPLECSRKSNKST